MFLSAAYPPVASRSNRRRWPGLSGAGAGAGSLDCAAGFGGAGVAARTGLVTDIAGVAAGRAGSGGVVTSGVGCGRTSGAVACRSVCGAGDAGASARGTAGRAGAGRGPGCKGAACDSSFLPANKPRRKSINPTTAPTRRLSCARAVARARGRVGRPLARLWTHGLSAYPRGTVAKSCAQGAAPAKHRGTAGWLRAGTPSRPPLWPRTMRLSTAASPKVGVLNSSLRPTVHHRFLAAFLEAGMRPQLTRHQSEQSVARTTGGRSATRPAH